MNWHPIQRGILASCYRNLHKLVLDKPLGTIAPSNLYFSTVSPLSQTDCENKKNDDQLMRLSLIIKQNFLTSAVEHY